MSKKFVTPAKLARIHQAAQAFVCDGAGIVPNHDAGFEEPIYKVANEEFGLKAILATVHHGLEALEPDARERLEAAISTAYDTTLMVGYMFGASVGLHMAAGFALLPTKKAR